MNEHDHALIDAAARSFTRGEPRRDLRRQVLARLDPHASPTSFSWVRSAAFARFAVAAAVVVAIGAGFLRPRAPIEEAQTPGTRPVPLAAASPRTETTAGTAAGEAGAGTARPSAPRRARTAPMTAAEQAWAARAVPALVKPDAVRLTPIQPEAVTIALLDLTPLTIAPIGTTDGGRD